MEQERRVVVTGIGMVTPVGLGAESTWESLHAGRGGVAPIRLFDATGFATRIAAESRSSTLPIISGGMPPGERTTGGTPRWPSAPRGKRSSRPV